MNRFEQFIENILEAAAHSFITFMCGMMFLGLCIWVTFVLAMALPMIVIPILFGLVIARLVYVGLKGNKNND